MLAGCRLRSGHADGARASSAEYDVTRDFAATVPATPDDYALTLGERRDGEAKQQANASAVRTDYEREEQEKTRACSEQRHETQVSSQSGDSGCTRLQEDWRRGWTTCAAVVLVGARRSTPPGLAPRSQLDPPRLAAHPWHISPLCSPPGRCPLVPANAAAHPTTHSAPFEFLLPPAPFLLVPSPASQLLPLYWVRRRGLSLPFKARLPPSVSLTTCSRSPSKPISSPSTEFPKEATELCILTIRPTGQPATPILQPFHPQLRHG